MFVENIIKIVSVEQKVESYLLFVFLPISKNPTESSLVFIYFSFLGKIVELNLSLSALAYYSSLYVYFFSCRFYATYFDGNISNIEVNLIVVSPHPPGKWYLCFCKAYP